MSKMPDKLFIFFLYYIKKNPLSFLIMFLVPAVTILESSVIPYAFKMLIDIFAQYKPGDNKENILEEISPALFLACGSWLAMIFITRFFQFLESYIVPNLQADVRMTVFKYTIGHSHRYFSDNMSGDIANRINDLPDSLETIRQIVCWHVIPTFFAIIIALAITWTISPIFSLILFSWSLIHMLIVSYFTKFLDTSSRKHAESKNKLSGTIIDVISNILALKLFNGSLSDVEYTNSKQIEEKKAHSTFIRNSCIFQLLIDIPSTIMLIAIGYYLVIGWQNDRITAGDFIFVFNVTISIMHSMMALGHVLSQMFHEFGKIKQGLFLLSEKYDIVERENARDLKVSKGRIEINDISFGYNKNNKIFQKENLIIEAGQKVGVVGYSGSGKSTLTNLILRFYDLDSGNITIDDQDIKKVTLSSLRENITMIPQDTILFHRSIIDNIKYGMSNATCEEVIEASKQAHAHKFISELPQGYKTMVGERGIKLSGGQRQRIAIARAILKNSHILIFDEATSALDSVTEKYIQDSFYLLMKHKTTIMIAHRLSTLIGMDRIIVFDNGKIIEDGTHQELIKKNGHYKKMWDMQVGPNSGDV